MTEALNPFDGDLLRRILAGDEAAFTLLYRRHSGGIYRFALHMSGNSGTAEEVTQEVFMALIREPQRYDPDKGSLPGFLYGIARHHLLRGFERERRFVPLDDADGNGTLPPGAVSRRVVRADSFDSLVRMENIERVRQAVLTLPESYREVVVLCDLQEMSYVEAAAALGCAVGTVRSRLHRGRALLLEKFRSVPESQAPPARAGRTQRASGR
jgi:RNA polymerase sigma-70 factor (ECF subfamily)